MILLWLRRRTSCSRSRLLAGEALRPMDQRFDQGLNLFTGLVVGKITVIIEFFPGSHDVHFWLQEYGHVQVVKDLAKVLLGAHSPESSADAHNCRRLAFQY